MTTISRKSEDVAWYSLSAEDATRWLSVVPTQGSDAGHPQYAEPVQERTGDEWRTREPIGSRS
jgi:hypothetical protein